MRKTTSEEIEQLYQFTRQHYVEFYDVQTELVDHLASSMEENWEKEPELSFEENLQREFKKFGVFGFMDVVDMKIRVMEKRYFRLIGKEMKSQLQHPKVLLAFAGIFVGALMLLKFGNSALIAAVVIPYFAIVWTWMYKTQKELNRKKKAGERLYLLEAGLLNTGGIFSISYIPFQILYYFDFAYTELWVQFITALVFALLVYSCFICFYVLPRKRDEILKRQYPELKF